MMPAETLSIGEGSSADVSRRAGEIECAKNGEKRPIKVERDFDRDNASLLYTLAAAAASRTSTPSRTVKKEAKSPSPERSSPIRDSIPSGVKLEKPTSGFRDYRSRAVHSSQNNGSNAEASAARTSECLEASKRLLAGESNEEGITQNSPAAHASQLHLMEAMMQRQRQLYEEYGHNNWMKMQRNDRNCLSKSKAKRYRWCVQKNQENENMNDSMMTTNTTPTTIDFTAKKKLPTKRPSTNPMHDKLYGTVFTGASKFRCRDCGKSFTTLVDLTVHMSKTGHYRDQNLEPEMKSSNDPSKFVKPKKRSMVEMEEKESAEKVLKCLGCGHSFESLQDLTVHMIKTKHYEDVTSLRLYNQKNDFPGSSVGAPSAAVEEKPPTTSLHVPNGTPADFSVPDVSDYLKYVPSSMDHSAMNLFGAGAIPPGFGSQPNFANMLSMAALRLLGGFPPYFAQMPFTNAINGYDMAGAAYAAAAARLFLSSPWLSQMPGLASGSIFPPFLNPHTPLPPTILSQSRQQSPIAGDVAPLPTSTHSTASSRGSNRPGSSSSQTHNGSIVDCDESLSSKSKVLRCVQCGESFSSLQKMTDHMRETTHFPIAMTPPSDEMNQRRGSRCSSNSESIIRGSPQSKGSPQHPSVPVSSPLEQLAKLACGNSLIPESSSSHSKHGTHVKAKSSSPVLSESPRGPSPDDNSMIPYIRPESPRKTDGLPKTGFDFIKSLESTIQSAISRVNQPATSSSFGRQVQPFQKQQPRAQKSRKQHILNAFLPNPPPTHRKSLPDNCLGADHATPLGNVRKYGRELGRPASDGEEYYGEGEGKSNATTNSTKLCSQKGDGESPPLDLSKSAQKQPQNSPESEKKEVGIGTKANRAPVDDRTAIGQKNPIQCIKDDMQSLFETNSRQVSKGEKRSGSPSSSLTLSRPHVDSEDPPKKRARVSGEGPGDYPIPPSKTNPLKEMQRIINATEMGVRDNKSAFSKLKNGPLATKRKMESDMNKHDHVRTFAPRSVLADLVRHDDDMPPSVDPLAQMENLVNLKIGQNMTVEKSPSIHSKKTNFSKMYSPSPSEAAATPRNGTNPMSALLNLFTLNRAIDPADRSEGDGSQGTKTLGNDTEKRRKLVEDEKNIALSTAANDTDKLKEKMTELFRSMFAQTQSPCLERKFDKMSRKPTQPLKFKRVGSNERSPTVHRDSGSDRTLTPFHELLLQKIFTEHFRESVNDINVSDSASEALSIETGLSVATIKDWVSNTKKELRENGQCGFVELSESSPSFRCTSCAAKSAQGLSARDFLHHLSTHISAKDECCSPQRRYSEDEVDTPRKREWEMIYRGAMHFKPLNAGEGSSAISLNARVSDSPVETAYPASPEMEIATEKRKHVEVVEDSPIKVSG